MKLRAELLSHFHVQGMLSYKIWKFETCETESEPLENKTVHLQVSLNLWKKIPSGCLTQVFKFFQTFLTESNKSLDLNWKYLNPQNCNNKSTCNQAFGENSVVRLLYLKYKTEYKWKQEAKLAAESVNLW